MMDLQTFRLQHPQYDDMSDEQLTTALHKKYYSDIPFDQFATSIGAKAAPMLAKGNREMSWGETAVDAAKSLGTGIEQGAIGIAGMAGDVPQLLGKGFGYVYDKATGASPEQIAQNQASFDQNYNDGAMGYLTSDAITKGVESLTGPMYQPKTTIGEYANTVGQWVPALAGGPAGGVKQLAKTTVKRVLAPAVATETAGQVARQVSPEDESTVRILTGIAAGGLSLKGAEQSAMNDMRGAAPAQDVVRAKTNQLYKTLDDAGVKYDSISYSQMIRGVEDKLKTFRPRKAPLAHDTLDYIREFDGKSPSFRDMEDIRQEATSILRDGTASDTDKKAAGIIISELENYANNAPLITNGSISADQVAPLAKQARELARRNIIAKQITEISRKAKSAVAGEESGLRNKFSSYMQSQKGVGLTDEEAAAFDKVIKREGVDNLLSSGGSRLIGTTLGGLGGFQVGGPIGGALGLAGHLALRKISELKTKKSVNDALKTVLAGKDAQKKATAAGKAAKNAELIAKSQNAAVSAESAKAKGRGALVPFYQDAHGRWWTKDGQLVTE